MPTKREPVSLHGRLFGGDSMYEVLVRVAAHGSTAFNAHQIAEATGRHPSQVQRDLDRLTAIQILEPVASPGAAKPLRRRKTALAKAVLSLPKLIEDEIGEYERPTHGLKRPGEIHSDAKSASPRLGRSPNGASSVQRPR